MDSIQSLVSDIKEEMFLFSDSTKLVSVSAYDTAWLTMIPDSRNESSPLFQKCLNWIMENQKNEGFWGQTDDTSPAIDALPATVICMVVLKKWNQGQQNIEKGLAFLRSAAVADILQCQNLPRWFALVFPETIELAADVGLELVFPKETGLRIADIFVMRQTILKKQADEKLSQLCINPPLLSYLEVLPVSCFDEQQIVEQLSMDGSLYQSPSATARAFLVTKNINCIKYLQSVVQKFPNGGVPEKYPVDEGLINLCLVDHIQRLGLEQHFEQEIQRILDQIYCNSFNRSEKTSNLDVLPMRLLKQALIFRLMRMQRHNVHPESYCWFLKNGDIKTYIEENPDKFISAMYNVYMATDISFPGEIEALEARVFARNILQNSNSTTHQDLNFVISQGYKNVIKHELNVPWIARLDHLNHRIWIEENNASPLWIGKASFYRFPCLDNNKLAQLAIENFEFRQSIYRQELEELKRWSKEWKLSEMGFGREKTSYAYFVIAACSSHPFDSILRLVIAKAGIIVTVADDFYDIEGSENELKLLTSAVQRWDGEMLIGNCKIIFNALDAFVTEYAAATQLRSQIVAKIQSIWSETLQSWMVEKRWNLKGYIPTIDEYLENAMISVAVHTIALPATNSFFNENFSYKEDKITKLLMLNCRLLNDAQSHEKEEIEGKLNFVHLYMEHNHSGIKDSIAHVKKILEYGKQEFLKHIFENDEISMSNSFRQQYLSFMKIYQMLYNGHNNFDNETALVDDINKAIYLPISRKPRNISYPL